MQSNSAAVLIRGFVNLVARLSSVSLIEHWNSLPKQGGVEEGLSEDTEG